MTWELTGNAGTSPTTNFLGTTDGQPLTIQPGTGNVGIGTTIPNGKLAVTGNWDGQHGALTLSGEKPTIRFSGDAISGNQQWLLHEGSNGPGDLVFFNGGTTGTWSPVMALKPGGGIEVIGNWDEGHVALKLTGEKPTIWFSGDAVSGTQQWILHEGSNGPGDLVFFNGGTTGSDWSPVMALKPSGKVEVTGNWDGQHGALTLTGAKPTIRFSGDDISGNQQWIIHEGSNGPGDLEFYNGGTTGAWSRVMSLTRGGNVEVTGDIRLTNAGDCAEEFNVAGVESIEPGTVMVLGDTGGTLWQSQKAYDKRVAGVISGAGGYKPGIILNKQDTQMNRGPLALLGKVYCKADASNQPIEVGDLLTTSDRPGHAMKAADPLKAIGSIIGKALQPLEEGQGLIPILIALQ